MTAPDRPPVPPRSRPRTGRLLLLAILAGVLLGAFAVITMSALRPRPTGIAGVDIVTMDSGDGPGVGYVLDLRSERAGYPVVVYVDGDGFPSLLFPTNGIARIEAGTRVRLPDPDGNATWWVPAGDRATVLTVLAKSPPVDVDRLVELVERAAARADDPGRALRNVKSVLRDRLGEPEARTLDSSTRG